MGDKNSQKSYILGRVDGWVKCMQRLSHAAMKELQAAFTSVTKSLLGFYKKSSVRIAVMNSWCN